MFVVRLFTLLIAVILCASCGIISDRSNEYMGAKDDRELNVPDLYSDSKIIPRYPIPEILNKKRIKGEFKLPLPPDATAALDNDPYNLEEIEGQSWLHLYTAPGRVWPLLDYFWAEHQVELSFEDAANGYVLTKSLDSDGKHASLVSALTGSSYSPAYSDGTFFQAKVTQGVRRNTSELYIRAIVPGSNDLAGRSDWQEEAVNLLLEKALLELIGEFVTADEQANRYSLLANDLGSHSRVQVAESEDGSKILEFDLGFQRAWAEVEQALDASTAIVSDRDRSQKVIYISYLDESELDSWFSSEASRNAKRVERNLSLRFSVNEENKVTVRIEIENPKIDAEKAEELLNMVFEHIS